MISAHLLNKTLTLKRKVDKTLNGAVVKTEYGEPETELKTISSNIKCRLERITEQDLLQAFEGGDAMAAKYLLFANITGFSPRSGDIVEFSATPIELASLGPGPYCMTVYGSQDAAGQGSHYEIVCSFTHEIGEYDS